MVQHSSGLALHAAASPPLVGIPWSLRGDTHGQRGGQGAGALAECRVPGVTTPPQGSETGLPVPGGGLLGRAKWGAHGVPRPHLHLQDPLPGGGEHPGEVRLQGKAPFPRCWWLWVVLRGQGYVVVVGPWRGEWCVLRLTHLVMQSDWSHCGRRGWLCHFLGTSLGGLTDSLHCTVPGGGGSCRQGLLGVQG